MRTTDTQRRDIEERLRRAARALLRGDLPPGGKADITTLTQMAGISRAALYRSYPHIKAEFGQQLAELRSAGQAPDPRDAQIQRLRHQNAELKRRISDSEAALAEHGNSRPWHCPASPPSTRISSGFAVPPRPPPRRHRSASRPPTSRSRPFPS